MSRYRGIFNLSGNYEPTIAAPLDARSVVEFFSDLTNPATWTIASGTPWLFDGLLVCVTNDPDVSKKGLYILVDSANYTVVDSWRKLADIKDIEALNEKIESIQGGGGDNVVSVANLASLPNVGSSSKIYIVEDENATYRWDENTVKYYCIGRNYEDIKIISGGNAAGIDGGEN